MKLAIFGLSVSSAWGNGHATLWRGLWRALARRGHHVVFFEHDMPWYAAHRDLMALPGGRLHLYREWDAIRTVAEDELRDSDAAIVTSYCPDGPAAAELVLQSTVGGPEARPEAAGAGWLGWFGASSRLQRDGSAVPQPRDAGAIGRRGGR